VAREVREAAQREIYFVTLGGRERRVEFGSEELLVDGEIRRVRLLKPEAGVVGTLWLDGRAVPLSAVRDHGEWWIRVEGRRFRVRVEDERARAIRQLAQVEGRERVATALCAPMPGLIVRLEVKEGQRVDKGAGLVVMEAMKMENELRAETACVIGSIEVDEGQAVNQGDVLVRFDG